MIDPEEYAKIIDYTRIYYAGRRMSIYHNNKPLVLDSTGVTVEFIPETLEVKPKPQQVSNERWLEL